MCYFYASKMIYLSELAPRITSIVKAAISVWLHGNRKGRRTPCAQIVVGIVCYLKGKKASKASV